VDGASIEGKGEEDNCETERQAILDWRHGESLYRREKYSEALAGCERAERRLPPGGEKLRKRLAESMNDLASKFIWPGSLSNAIYSPEAERLLSKVVEWLPDNANAWYNLGATLYGARKLDQVIVAYERAIELDPKDAYPHHGLGHVYSALSQYEEAIAAYWRAIELDPKDASPHKGLGIVYQLSEQYEKAEEAFRKAIELDPQAGSYRSSIAGIVRKLGRESEAAEQIKIARELIANRERIQPRVLRGDLY
jgi:tetratricopeptide (TPR) repeat protein